MNERKRKQLNRMIQAYAKKEYTGFKVDAEICRVDTDYYEDMEIITVSFYREDNPDWGFNLKVYASRNDKPLFILGMLAEALMNRE